LLTASGSGLDPHLTPAAVLVQVPRVIQARQLTATQEQTLLELIARLTESSQIGPARVNILRLNLALNDAFPPA
jgi:K+-transporting ATPase ATPase C chain